MASAPPDYNAQKKIVDALYAQQRASQPYLGLNPGVALAYKNDPRVQAANTLEQIGSSTAPVARGSWGTAEGLSRIAAGLGSGFLTNQAQNEYKIPDRAATLAERDADVKQAAATTAQRAAGTTPAEVAGTAQAQAAATPAPAPVAPAPQSTSQADTTASSMANAPPVQPATPPPPPVAPAQSAAAPVASALTGTAPAASLAPNPTQAGAQSPAPPVQTQDSSTPSPPMPVPASSVVPDASQASQPSATTQPLASTTTQTAAQPRRILQSQYYFDHGIIPNEGGTDAQGNFLKSKAGAIGPGQLLPGTARDAARMAGLPFDDYKYRHDAAYNRALGSAYYAYHLRNFGDPLQAAAAYNDGAGRVHDALKYQQQTGNPWVTDPRLPQETKSYVASFAKRLGLPAPGGAGAATTAGGTAPAGMVGPNDVYQQKVDPLVAAPTPVQAPTFGDRVRSDRLAIAQNLVNDNPNVDPMYLMAAAKPLFDQGFTEDMASKVQREADVNARQNAGYASANSLFNTLTSQRQQAQITDRQNQIAANTAAVTAGQEQQYTLARQAAAAQAAQTRVDTQSQTRLQEAQIRAGQMPKGPGQQYATNAATIEELNRVRALVAANPDSFGVKFKPGELWANTADPNGRDARNAVAKIATMNIIRNGGGTRSLSGIAGQTINAYGDNSDTILSKIDQLLATAGEVQKVYDKAYPNALVVQNLQGGNGVGGPNYQPSGGGGGVDKKNKILTQLGG